MGRKEERLRDKTKEHLQGRLELKLSTSELVRWFIWSVGLDSYLFDAEKSFKKESHLKVWLFKWKLPLPSSFTHCLFWESFGSLSLVSFIVCMLSKACSKLFESSFPDTTTFLKKKCMFCSVLYSCSLVFSYCQITNPSINHKLSLYWVNPLIFFYYKLFTLLLMFALFTCRPWAQQAPSSNRELPNL